MRDRRILLVLLIQVVMWVAAVFWYKLVVRRLSLVETNFSNYYLPSPYEMGAFWVALVCGFISMVLLGWIWWKPKKPSPLQGRGLGEGNA